MWKTNLAFTIVLWFVLLSHPVCVPCSNYHLLSLQVLPLHLVDYSKVIRLKRIEMADQNQKLCANDLFHSILLVSVPLLSNSVTVFACFVFPFFCSPFAPQAVTPRLISTVTNHRTHKVSSLYVAKQWHCIHMALTSWQLQLCTESWTAYKV